MRLGAVHPDPASLRRYLVDEGFMARKSGVYRLRPRSEWPRAHKTSRLRQRSRASANPETAPAPEPRHLVRSRRTWRRWWSGRR